MIERHHTHWQRLTVAPHQVRREVEGQVQGMPLAVDSRRITPAQKLDSLAVIAIVAVPAAGYVFNATAAVLVALVFAAACMTQWVTMRRGA